MQIRKTIPRPWKISNVTWHKQVLSENGSSAVELAIVLPILITILAGIMDFGILFTETMAMRQGVGSGVRQGIVAQPGTSSTCSITGASAASTPTKQLICLTKSRIGLDATSSRTKILFPGIKTKGGSLIICAQYPMTSATTLFDPLLDGVTKSKVEMRIEQDLSAFDSIAETALPGGDWTWCV